MPRPRRKGALMKANLTARCIFWAIPIGFIVSFVWTGLDCDGKVASIAWHGCLN